MSVSREHASRIAALARLRFDEDELTRITEELNQVLGHVETLKSLDVDDVPEGDDPLDGEGDATRGPAADAPDTLGSGIEAMAPDTREGFFVVPPLPGVQVEEDA